MELDNIVGCLKQITAPHLLRFVSEKGENSCEKCKKYHNLIFEENDKNIPKIPIHPNCRCKFEHVKNDELEKIKENIEKLSKPIDYWAKQILSHGNQLLRDVDTIMLKGFEHHYTVIHANVKEELLQYCAWMGIEPVMPEVK